MKSKYKLNLIKPLQEPYAFQEKVDLKLNSLEQQGIIEKLDHCK